MSTADDAMPWLKAAVLLLGLAVVGIGYIAYHQSQPTFENAIRETVGGQEAEAVPGERLLSSPVGQPAPEFLVPTLSGDTLSNRDLRDRVVILHFFASWCEVCREDQEVLRRTEQSYPEDSVQVVGVVYHDSPEAAAGFTEKLGGDWPSLRDPESRLAKDFGVYGIPETFFLSPDGVVAKKQIDSLTWEIVRSTVDSLLTAS